MDFRKWIENTDRVNELLCNLIDCHISIVGLANDFSLIAEENVKNPPKSLMDSLRKRFSNLATVAKDAARDEWGDWVSGAKTVGGLLAAPFRRKRNNSSSTTVSTTSDTSTHKETPEEKSDRLSYELQAHTMHGYYDNDPVWKSKYNSLISQIHALSDDSNKDHAGVYTSRIEPANDATVRDAQSKIKKARNAIITLRDVLKDPQFEPILKHLEQEVEKINKPGFYRNMGAGEQSWYDNLSDENRSKFDSEMSKSGNQVINRGDEWWNVAAQRAQKAANQGYSDADANWKWAAGYANRQKIRRSMNPEWERQLQGESLTPGGKLFREWLKRRVEAATPGVDGVEADTPGNVVAPSDSKEIARRKAVSGFTSSLMKKNPKLKPGSTDQQTVANAVSTDPRLSKADPDTQKAVSGYFLSEK